MVVSWSNVGLVLNTVEREVKTGATPHLSGTMPVKATD